MRRTRSRQSRSGSLKPDSAGSRLSRRSTINRKSVRSQASSANSRVSRKDDKKSEKSYRVLRRKSYLKAQNQKLKIESPKKEDFQKNRTNAVR